MSTFDPTKFQASPNGPLTPETIQRLVDIKNRSGMSYHALGKALGVSGPFVHSLVNKAANVGTQHIERIVAAIGTLENAPEHEASNSGAPANLRHSFHLRPDRKVEFELPTDLTEREAERLARFIQSLPVT